MKVAVCVPHRPVDEERIANRICSGRQWEALGWPVHEADSDGLFSRAHAINSAATRADGDVLVIADTDIVLADPRQAQLAALMALKQTAYVVSFNSLIILGPRGSDNLRQGKKPPESTYVDVIKLIWGGCFAVSRVLFDRVGGFDERFVGYGAEDVGFLVSASTLGVKHRVVGEAYHLFHPDPDKSTLTPNSLLGRRYLQADGDKKAVRVLMRERPNMSQRRP